MGVLVALRMDETNFIRDVLNFIKNVPNFVNDVPRVSKCIPRWKLASNHFLIGFEMK